MQFKRFWSVVFLVLASCSASMEDSMGYAKMASSSGKSADTGRSLPPEEKEVVNDQFLGVAPAYTADYIFVANPSINSISRIDVKTRAIEVVPTGLYPQVIKGSGNRILVLNAGDHSITFVTASTLKTFTVPIPKDINDIAFNGENYGLAYVNADKLDKTITGGSQSTNVAAVIDIAAGTVKLVSIDFTPKTLVFTTDANYAPTVLLATDSRGTRLNLSNIAQKKNLVFSSPLTRSTLEEALITPDGARAFFREAGQSGIRVLEVSNLTLSNVADDAVPTDIDLVRPTGSNKSFLYVSDQDFGYRLRVYDTSAAAMTLTTTITSAYQFRQTEFSPDGTKAILFSSTADEAAVGILDTATDTIMPVVLSLPTANVLPAPDSLSALIIHRGFTTGNSPPATVTMLNLVTSEQPSFELQGKIDQITFTPSGAFGFLTTKDPSYLDIMSLRGGFQKPFALYDSPLFLAALPGANEQAFVMQDYLLGRITFVQPTVADSDIYSNPTDVTGFLRGTEAE